LFLAQSCRLRRRRFSVLRMPKQGRQFLSSRTTRSGGEIWVQRVSDHRIGRKAARTMPPKRSTQTGKPPVWSPAYVIPNDAKRRRDLVLSNTAQNQNQVPHIRSGRLNFYSRPKNAYPRSSFSIIIPRGGSVILMEFSHCFHLYFSDCKPPKLPKPPPPYSSASVFSNSRQ
jgi:hypothetical protein